MKRYNHFLNEEKEYKNPIDDKKFIDALIKTLKSIGMDEIELDGNDLSFVNPTHLDTGSIGKMKDSKKVEQVIKKFGYDDDEFIIRSSFIEIPNEYVVEGSYFVGGNSYNMNADSMAAYNDMSPSQRKMLDDYCKTKFGNQFLNCTYDEQSTARSVVWTTKEDPEEIERQNDKDAEF